MRTSNEWAKEIAAEFEHKPLLNESTLAKLELKIIAIQSDAWLDAYNKAVETANKTAEVIRNLFPLKT